MKPFFSISRMAVTLLFFVASLEAHAQTNNAIVFDGVDDYINIPDHNALDLSANFTLEVWIYPTGVGSQPTEGGMILNKESSYELARFANGSIRFALSANGTGSDWTWTNTGVVAPLNRWSHIALVKSGSTVTFYLNGMASGTFNSQPATLTPNANALRIGNRTDIGHYFNGSMDEIRIWNTARTAEQLKTYMFNRNLTANASGLVGYYRLNETSGTNAGNASTNTSGIDGTLINGAVRNTSPVQYGANALSFDGVNDYVVSTATFNMNMNASSFTMEAWINSANSLANATTERIIMQWGNTFGVGSYRLVCTNNYINFNFNGSSTGSCTYNVGWQDGNWHHVAGVFNVTTHMLYLYFDGVQQAAVSTGTNAPGALNGSLYIGGSPSIANSFVSAQLDEIRVWNSARSQAQIQANMNIELSHPYFNSANVPRLYYNFNQGSVGGTNTGLVTVTEQYLEAHGNGTLFNFALSGSGSSNFTAQNNLFLLPVKWLGFTAQKQNIGVLLEWSTASEVSTKDFVIEHKTGSGDWKRIATIAAAGNTNRATKYQYKHLAPEPGVNYYRIKQNDVDAKFTYSEIRVVTQAVLKESFQLLQNTGSGKVLRIQINQRDGLPVSLFNAEGRLVWKKALTQGVHNIQMNQVPQGIYFLRAGRYSERVLLR